MAVFGLAVGTAVAEATGWEALGFTVAAGMFFVAGAAGAWARAVVSGTQVVMSQRTIVDLLIGGCGGILLPLFSPILDRVFGIEFKTWNTLQQTVMAFLIGGGGTWLWTAIGWRTGIIVSRSQAANGVTHPPPPEIGVLQGSAAAKEAATEKQASKKPRMDSNDVPAQ